MSDNMYGILDRMAGRNALKNDSIGAVSELVGIISSIVIMSSTGSFSKSSLPWRNHTIAAHPKSF